VRTISPYSTADRRAVERRASTDLASGHTISFSFVDDDIADLKKPDGTFLAMQQNQMKTLLHKLVVTQLYKPRLLLYE